MNAPHKPIVIAKEEARTSLVSTINDIISIYQLPFFILEPIMKDIYNEVARKADLEYKQANEQYKIELAEWEMSMSASEPKSEN